MTSPSAALFHLGDGFWHDSPDKCLKVAQDEPT